jgi:hypothetical protein
MPLPMEAAEPPPLELWSLSEEATALPEDLPEVDLLPAALEEVPDFEPDFWEDEEDAEGEEDLLPPFFLSDELSDEVEEPPRPVLPEEELPPVPDMEESEEPNEPEKPVPELPLPPDIPPPLEPVLPWVPMEPKEASEVELLPMEPEDEDDDAFAPPLEPVGEF